MNLISQPQFNFLIIATKNLKIISTKAERESLRKRIEKLIPKLDKAKVVENFEKEEIALSTIYAHIKRFENLNYYFDGMST